MAGPEPGAVFHLAETALISGGHSATRPEQTQINQQTHHKHKDSTKAAPPPNVNAQQ